MGVGIELGNERVYTFILRCYHIKTIKGWKTTWITMNDYGNDLRFV